VAARHLLVPEQFGVDAALTTLGESRGRAGIARARCLGSQWPYSSTRFGWKVGSGKAKRF